MLLAVLMVLTVAPVSMFASAADPAYTYGDVSFSKTEFSVNTSGTTDVIRIAASAGSFSVPASGQEGVIVSATPSGIPSNSGTYKDIAYAGETPSPAKIVFSITGIKPDAVPTITATNISGFAATVQTPVTSGDTTTYTWNITGGSALKGANVVFTITYKLKGVSYQAFAYSHVEHILVMNGWLTHLSRTSGTNVKWRHALAFQLQSKNMYSGMNSGTPTKTLGYINYASEGAMNGGALKGFGNEDNVDGSVDAYGSAVPNNSIPGEEVGAFIKFRNEQGGGRYNGCFSDDGNRSESMVYIDRRDEDLRSLNMRATIQAGETDKFSSIWLQEMTFHNYAHTFGSEDYDFTSTASASEFSAVNYTSGNTGTNTLTKPSTVNDLFKQYLMIPITGTGPASSTTASSPYSITADLYTNDTFVAASMNVDFRIYDSTVLWNVYNGVLNGKALNGSTTYTTPSSFSAAPNFACVFDKGAHPQASQFSGGWSAFKSALDTAGCLLQAPDVTQADLDNAAVALYQAYTNLTGYNGSVNWEINHYLEGTTTPIIPTQTVDPVAPTYGQPQPAGSVWLASAATIDGYVLTSSESQNMTLSGQNAKESFTFYYKPREYNLIVETNTGADASIALTPTGKKIYESEIDTGTLANYSFDGWYYDDGVWSQPVFSNSLSDEGGRYFLMPGQQTTIFAKWVTTPVDIQYIPVADGVELPTVSRGEQVKYPDGQTTAQFARPADLSVDGYLFVNFYADKELTTPVSFPLTFTLGETQTPYTIYARMVDVNGRISFESNGGTAVNDISFTAGQTVNAPAAPTMKGYSFAGWYDQSLTTEYTFPRTMSNNTGFIAYAKWEPNEYTIEFDLGTPATAFDTESIPNIVGYADTEIAQDDMPVAPKKFGYVFHHWELNGERYDLVKYPTENITLTPYWVESDYSAFIDINAYEKLSGNYVETSEAEIGDVITFRMVSQTNFFTGSSLFVFMYDKDFFELVNTGNDAFVLNDNSDYISGINATHIGVTTDSSLPWPSGLAAARNDYNAMMVAIDPTVTSTAYKTAPMKDGQWIVEFQLRIKEGATGSGKVYMDNEWTRTPDNIMGTMFYGWSKESTEVYNTFNNVVVPDLDLAFAEVSIEEVVTPDTSVKLLSGDGTFADGTTEKSYTGRAETEILDYVAPSREGYDLSGWTKTSDGTTVDWTDEFYYPSVENVGSVVEYTANWEAKKYPVTFYTDDTLATVFYKLEYAYDSEMAGPPITPSKQGYVFKAWVNAETGEEVVLPALCKGEANFYPTFAPATNTPYTIKITYLNNQTGADASTTRSLTGTTGYTVVIDTVVGSAPNTIYVTPADLPTVTGYEFDTVNNVLPITGVIAADGSLVLDVRYKAAIMNVTLDANGGTFAGGAATATISGEFQTAIKESDLPAPPTRPGYNFTGYQGLTFTDGVSNQRYRPNATYRAQWAEVKYTMTFDAGDGAYADGSKTKTAEVAMNGAINAPEVPTLEGWSFIGWSLNGGDATTSLGTLDVAETRTYVAVFEKTPYNVYYYIDYALDAERSEIKYVGDAVTIAGEPTKYGYEFSGWTINGAPAADFTMGAADVEIYGEFTAKTFDVTFDANGGFFDGDTAVTTKAVATVFDSTINPPATAPARAGYEFLGWAASLEDAAAKTTVTSWPTLQTEDAVTYYAVWNATIWDYTVKFYYQDVNGQYGAEAADETIVLQGQVEYVVTFPAEDNKNGFTLDTENSVLSGTVSVDNPLVLEVKYARKQYTLTVDIDGQKTTSEVYYGAAVAVPADPAKEGFTFDGWNGYSDGMTMPNEDLTITAIFTAKQFTVTYYTDSTKAEVAYTRTAAYGSDYNVPTPGMNNVPTKEGHDFTKWISVSTGADSGLAAGSTTQMPLNGAEYYAEWTVKTYNITYRGQGGTWEGGNAKTYAVEYGTAKADMPTPDAAPSRAGYTFTGWDIELPETMPAQNIDLLAQWSKESYTVIFKDSLTDEVYSEESYGYGDPVYAPYPDKEGYEFLYWADENGNEVTPMDSMADIGADGATVTYIAKWNALEFTISFVDTGDVAYEAITQAFGTAIAPVANPVKTGYTFTGWDNEIPATMPAEDLTITAQWSINQYTITFVDTGDVAYEAITKDYKAAVGTVADPVKTGYTFNGWDVAIPATMPAEDLTITAQWTINQYTITFADTGDSTIAPITQDFGTAVTAPAAPTKVGYEFTGWDAEIPATMPAENLTITAQWSIKQYTITFADTGDTVIAPITQDFGTAVTAPAAPVKEGYTFTGWDAEIPATMPAEDLKITAEWAINAYTITFDMDGGDAIAPITKDFGTAIDATAIVPNKIGYVFNGWVDANGDAAEIPATLPAEDITLKATWTVDQFTITFDMDGGDAIAPITQDYNTAIDATAIVPNKIGYTFAGWVDANGDAAEIPATMPAEDIALKATWTINTYTVTFLDAEGEVFFSTDLEYNATIAAPADAPVKEYYTFVGWSLTEVALGTKDAPVDAAALIDFENAAPTVIADDMTIYPAFDRVPVTLKLVAESTAVVETERAEAPITGYIYGLRDRLKEEALDDYLSVEGNGRLQYTLTKYGRVGTGTKVEVIDAVDDEVVETYYIIIFGDINGDATVNAADVAAIDAEISSATNWSNEYLGTDEYDYCKVLAADIAGINDRDGDGIDDDGLSGNGIVDSTDLTALNAVVLRYNTLDQTTGTIS